MRWLDNEDLGAGKTEPAEGFAEYGKTEPAQKVPQPSSFEDYGATEPVMSTWNVSSANSGGSVTVPNYEDSGLYHGSSTVPNFENNLNFGGTRGPEGAGFAGGHINSSNGGHGVTIPATPGGIPGFLPTVGWLICVEGPDRGRDYRIHDGYNTIGRGSNMDICINGDAKISRENHARIAYDPEERTFYFAPADGKNLVKLNGKTLLMAAELKPYDTLTIGTSKLKFIPFCGESFGWEDSKF